MEIAEVVPSNKKYPSNKIWTCPYVTVRRSMVARGRPAQVMDRQGLRRSFPSGRVMVLRTPVTALPREPSPNARPGRSGMVSAAVKRIARAMIRDVAPHAVLQALSNSQTTPQRPSLASAARTWEGRPGRRTGQRKRDAKLEGLQREYQRAYDSAVAAVLARWGFRLLRNDPPTGGTEGPEARPQPRG
jgi:hypothetical protein